MTSTSHHDMQQAAAQAALAVPGLAALQPALADRLAAVASRPQHAAGATSLPAGIRAERTSDGHGWNIEVRCVVHSHHRVLDVARQVRDQVHTAVTAYLALHGAPEPVSVQVTVTRTI